VARDVAIQDGKIVIAGTQRDDLQITQTLAARFRANGSLDRGFARRGVSLRQYARGGAYSAFQALTVAAGGRLVLAGTAIPRAGGPQALVVELSRGGKPVRGFDGDGVAYVPATSSPGQFSNLEPYPGAYGVTLSGGDIVLAGIHDRRGTRELALWALRSNGSPDRRFGQQGHVYRNFSGEYAVLNGAADGRGGVLAVGEHYRPGDKPTGIVTRYGSPR
jgi:hypothetical protein